MIQINGLTKKHGAVTVLDGITFNVGEGCVYGIVGGNGAGKTTLLNILSGAVRQTGGEVKVDGKDVRIINEVPNVIGFVQDEYSAFTYLTAREYLTYLGQLANIKKSVIESRIAFLAEMFNLTAALDMRSSLYSRGMKQKLSIAAVLLGNPKIVLMDEPTAALDTDAKEEMKGVIEKLKKSGKSVIIATNSLWDVENYCDVVGFMAKGKIKFERNVLDLVKEEKSGVAVFADVLSSAVIAKTLDGVEGYSVLRYLDKTVITNVDKTSEEILLDLQQKNLPYFTAVPYKESFKDAFIKEAKSK